MASVNGTIIDKREVYTKYGSTFDLDFSFRPENGMTIYTSTLAWVGLKTWQSTQIGDKVLVYYDRTNPKISYISGYQSTSRLDKQVMVLGGVISLLSGLLLTGTWRSLTRS